MIHWNPVSTEGYLLCPQVRSHDRLLAVRLQVCGGYGAEVIEVRLDGAGSFVMKGACPVGRGHTFWIWEAQEGGSYGEVLAC